jgi:Linalool dehydratase/isomerase
MTNRAALSREDIGHVRRIVQLSRQLPGDWSGMGSDWWDITERALQYQLAFAAYTLGLVQYHYTPAYRELCQPTMHALIQKMTLPDIWETWINSSRGGTSVDPDQTELGPGWMDPVKKYNVMLKGHLLQMGALYEALYRDGTYTKPGAFTFQFRATTWGNGFETFRYDLHDIARIIYDEYVESNYEGCQCEPNRIFPMCNQHAVLGLMHHDHVFGTSYAADVRPKFKQVWLEKGYTDLNTKSHMRMRFVRQDKVVPADTPWSDGWTGTFMHAWDRDFIEELYPHERAVHFENLLAGRDAARVATSMVPTSAKIGFGLFATLASEVGDTSTRDSLIAYADRNFNPRWSEEGAYFYPRSDDWVPDAQGRYHGVDVLTGNALLPMARINNGNGLWTIYNEPPLATDLDQPHVTGIDPTAAGVSQAFYDAESEVLHLSLMPGPTPKPVTIAVHRLDPARAYTIAKDGQHLATVAPTDAPVSDGVGWRGDGTLAVATSVHRAHSFVVVPVK